ncbi:MAG: ABC transporter ATP-binding protein [Actinobacteria bacterium]|nr:ABC transporter ATP-binding protein [Actinomycetota bacterium]
MENDVANVIDVSNISDLTENSSGSESRLKEAFQLIRVIVKFHPRLFTIAVSGAAVFAICTVGSSIGVRWMVDRVILIRFQEGRLDATAIVIGACLVIGIGLVRAAGVVVRRSYAGRTEWRTAESITNRVLDHVVAQPIAWHRKRMTGDIVARCGVDSDASVSILAPLPFASSVLVMMLVSSVWMLSVDIPLGVLAIIVFPILLMLNISYQKRIDRFYALAQDELGALSQAVHESFDGVMVVKSFGAENRETERLAVITSRLRNARIEAVSVRSMFEAAIDAIPSLINITLIVLGAIRVKSGAMSVGDLTSFIYLFTLLVFPLRIIGYLFSEIPHSVAGWRRVREVLDEPIGQDPNDVIRIAKTGVALSCANINYSHTPDNSVLRDLSLEILSGRTVAIVGATGCGKTTLLHLLSGLIECDSGSISVQPGGVGLVFQEAFLFAESLRFNITLDSPITDTQVNNSLRIAECTEFINDLTNGLDTIMGERGVSLSGGQRQRIALARAIAHNRAVLLLDDTTSALDPATEARVVNNLREMAMTLTKTTNTTTVVIVASRPSTIALADEVLYMRNGQIVDHARHDVLYTRNSDYRELINAFEHDRHE